MAPFLIRFHVSSSKPWEPVDCRIPRLAAAVYLSPATYCDDSTTSATPTTRHPPSSPGFRFIFREKRHLAPTPSVFHVTVLHRRSLLFPQNRIRSLFLIFLPPLSPPIIPSLAEMRGIIGSYRFPPLSLLASLCSEKKEEVEDELISASTFQKIRNEREREAVLREINRGPYKVTPDFNPPPSSRELGEAAQTPPIVIFFVMGDLLKAAALIILFGSRVRHLNLVFLVSGNLLKRVDNILGASIWLFSFPSVQYLP